MDILPSLRIYAFHVPNQVIAEIEYAEQLERLEAAIVEGRVTDVAALRVGILTAPEGEAIHEELARRRFVMTDVPPFEELLR